LFSGSIQIIDALQASGHSQWRHRVLQCLISGLRVRRTYRSLDPSIDIIRPSFRTARRQESDGPHLCRGLCRARADEGIIEFRSRSLDTLPADQGSKEFSFARTLHSLAKRVLTVPANIDTFMVNRFKNKQSFPFTEVYNAATKVHNSAEFRVINKAQVKFELGVQQLCSCSVVVIVSHEAVWFAHLL
jgi:hypothetical protein